MPNEVPLRLERIERARPGEGRPEEFRITFRVGESVCFDLPMDLPATLPEEDIVRLARGALHAFSLDLADTTKGWVLSSQDEQAILSARNSEPPKLRRRRDPGGGWMAS